LCCHIKTDIFFPTKDLVLFPHHVLIEIFEVRNVLSNNQKIKMKMQPFSVELMVK